MLFSRLRVILGRLQHNGHNTPKQQPTATKCKAIVTRPRTNIHTKDTKKYRRQEYTKAQQPPTFVFHRDDPFLDTII
jgi:hypothetical protein